MNKPNDIEAAIEAMQFFHSHPSREAAEKVMAFLRTYNKTILSALEAKRDGGWLPMMLAPRCGRDIWVYKLKFTNSPQSETNPLEARVASFMANGEWLIEGHGYYDDDDLLGFCELPTPPKTEGE